MIQSFKFHNFQLESVRTFTAGPDDFWFAAADVAKCLKYGDTDQAIRKNVSPKNTTTLGELYPRMGDGGGTDNLSRHLNLVLLNEFGLYELIFSSQKEEAKAFRNWVFEMVLPSIRKTGIYTHESVKQSRIETDNLNSKRVELTEKCNDTTELDGGITVGKCVDDAFAGLYRRGFKQRMGRIVSKNLPAIAVATVDRFQGSQGGFEITARVYSIEYKPQILKMILDEIEANSEWLIVAKPE